MIEAEKKSIWQKLANLDYKVIYLVALIISFLTILNPIGIPIEVSDYTREFYDTIENMSKGSTVMLAIALDPVSYPEIAPGLRASIVHLLRNNHKIIIWFYGYEAPPLWQTLLEEIPFPSGKEYGVDWVNLGYIPGYETAIAALASDIHEAAPFDYYGTPIEDITLMKNIKTGVDIDLYYCVVTSAESLEEALRQFWATFNTPIVGLIVALTVPMVMPYYPSQLNAFIGGVRGGAEYELMTRLPWKGLSYTDAISSVGLIIIAFVIIGNIGDIVSSRER